MVPEATVLQSLCQEAALLLQAVEAGGREALLHVHLLWDVQVTREGAGDLEGRGKLNLRRARYWKST